MEYGSSHRSYFKKKGVDRYANIEDKTSFNKNRYVENKDSFLKSRDKFARSVRGRVYSLYESAKDRSAKKNMVFEITLDYLLEKYEKQEGKCEMTGIPFTSERNPDGKRFYMPYSPSLDRIDSNKGYTKDNVRLVCVIVNLALNVFGEDVFKNMCQSYLANKGYSVCLKV